MRLLFGDCEFDSGQRVVCRHGRVIPLSPKAFQLLELLVERRPEVVAKTEILGHLWPETFVSDASLHNLVAEVRGALGDTPQVPRYIRTVPRYGYAFHADARAVVGGVANSERAVAGPRLLSRRREWPLSEGANLVGRGRDCSVRLDSATLSRHHARIVVTGTEATIEDLASKNGTLVNGQRVTRPVTLEENDEIQLGSVTMRYQVRDSLPSTLTRRGEIAE